MVSIVRGSCNDGDCAGPNESESGADSAGQNESESDPGDSGDDKRPGGSKGGSAKAEPAHLESSGCLLDKLMAKHAFEYIGIQHTSAIKSGQRIAFSLGAKTMTNIFEDLNSIGNPDPCIASSELQSIVALGDFDFQPEVVVADSHDSLWGARLGVDADGCSGSRCSNITMFSIYSLTPGKPKTVKTAPKITDSSSICVSLLEVLSADNKRMTVQVALEGATGSSTQSLCVLKSDALTISDLQSMIRWRVLDSLKYTFDVKVPVAKQAAVEDVTVSLIETQKVEEEGAQRYILMNEDENSAAKLDALQFLEGLEMAEMRSRSENSTTWALTALGKTSLQLRSELYDGAVALTPRAGVPMKDMSVFELHYLMQQAKWTSHVKGPRIVGESKKKLSQQRNPNRRGIWN